MTRSDDYFRINTNPVDAEGNKLEPEQLPTERVFPGAAPVELSQSGATGKAIGSEIVVEAPLGQFAAGMRRLCYSCVFFDQKAWNQYVDGAQHSVDIVKLHVINQVRANLITSQNAQIQEMHGGLDGSMEIEGAVRSMGLCRALTEHFKDDTIVHPMGCCPEGINGLDPNGFHRDRDESTRRMQNAEYDKLLRAGQNKG